MRSRVSRVISSLEKSICARWRFSSARNRNKACCSWPKFVGSGTLRSNDLNRSCRYVLKDREVTFVEWFTLLYTHVQADFEHRALSPLLCCEIYVVPSYCDSEDTELNKSVLGRGLFGQTRLCSQHDLTSYLVAKKLADGPDVGDSTRRACLILSVA